MSRFHFIAVAALLIAFAGTIRSEDPISNFPGPSAALESAFPERFVRCQTVDPDVGCNSIGQLFSVDLRPVNFDSSRRDTLRIGFDFSKPLKSAAPSQAAIAAFRARRAQTEGSGQPAAGAEQAGQEKRAPGDQAVTRDITGAGIKEKQGQ